MPVVVPSRMLFGVAGSGTFALGCPGESVFLPWFDCAMALELASARAAVKSSLFMMISLLSTTRSTGPYSMRSAGPEE
ncbi:hypothetical protein I6F35_09955 [Bradyrhizobium sp. BRP22]|uniref:hypothetical protein n=1 Tax=Bradyrhizobium sp. BRP22 TaxID=2793821 RepID=UPI001CD65977|nr:hypothetical protein [Bradyrhizobium sp. BRP22]MCA1453537.1 hypothetical protein [Bradyrhizobium sp. BRP22]